MNLAKLIFLTFPLFVTLTLFFAHRAEASVVKATPTTAHVISISHQQSNLGLTAPTLSQESNPIMENLGCSCSTCVKAKLELQGKLPFPGNF